MALFDDLTKKAAKFTEKTIEKSSELVDKLIWMINSLN